MHIYTKAEIVNGTGFRRGQKFLSLSAYPHTDGYRLIQFQCHRQGTLFYYVSGMIGSLPYPLCCPMCGSKRVEATGREVAGFDENNVPERETQHPTRRGGR